MPGGEYSHFYFKFTWRGSTQKSVNRDTMEKRPWLVTTLINRSENKISLRVDDHVLVVMAGLNQVQKI